MSQKPFRPSLPTIASSSYGYPHTGVSLSGKVGGYFAGESQGLPMYKDKPHYQAARPKATAVHKASILLLGVACVVWFSGMLSPSSSAIQAMFDPGSKSSSTPSSSKASNPTDWPTRREMVKEAFITSWDAYATNAWGMDEYHPISKKGNNMGCRPGTDSCPGAGWIIVDALDTAIMMNLTSRVAQAREWIKTSLDYSKLDGEMNTFETTIRVLGGLLSAHYLSTTFPQLAPLRDDDVGAKGEDLYIEKAVDLADRLLVAFETPSGIPVSSVNFKTGSGIPSGGDRGLSSTAEATTLQLEFKYVAKLTGEPLYWDRAQRVMEAIDGPRREGGLLPIFIHPNTGKYSGENIRLGSRGDSYYEYLIKQFLQTGSREVVFQDMWDEALEGIKKYLISWSPNANMTVLGERQNGLQGQLSGKMDHLVCFLPGSIALGVTGGSSVTEAKERMGSAWGKKQEQDLLLAEELMKTCWGMYAVTPTGLAPEIAYLSLDSQPRSWNTSDPDFQMPRSTIDFNTIPFPSPPPPGSTTTWQADYSISPGDTHNLQRPETIESLFYLYRITGNPQYREWGWKMFRAFSTHSAVTESGIVTGYTSLNSVLVSASPSHRDNMEGFWLAETLKYFYLLFSDVDEWHDLSKVVVNTEAHFLPRFDIGADMKIWKTGWSRKERGGDLTVQ